MKATQTKPVGKLHMSEAEFEGMMSAALRVKPEGAKKPKRQTKMKTSSRTADKKK
jgi:hypothetical protein